MFSCEPLLSAALMGGVGFFIPGCFCCGAGATSGYVFGGELTPIQDNDEYVPDTWTSRSNLPTPARLYSAGCAVSGLAVCFCGSDGAADIADTDSYELPATDTWTNRTNAPTAKGNHSAFAESGIAYNIGGLGASGPTEEWNEGGDSWAAKTTMPATIHSSISAGQLLSSGLGYVFAGNEPSASAVTQLTDEYNTGGDSWADKTDLPSPARADHLTGAIDEMGYCIGGHDGSNTLSDNDRYDRGGDSWTSKTSIVSPVRRKGSGLSLSDAIYCAYGASDVAILKDCDEYVEDTWTSKTDGPTPTRQLCSQASV